MPEGARESRKSEVDDGAERAWRRISVSLPKKGEKVTPETFAWHFDWDRIRKARSDEEGTCLLRTNLHDCDPKTLWK